jgi:xylulokinase
LILTLDLGTSTTKAIVWDDSGPVAMGRCFLETVFPSPERAEQDPPTWWPSVTRACDQARSENAGAYEAVAAVTFAAARQTFVPVTAEGVALGPALVWSDRRAAAEAHQLEEKLGGAEAVHQRTGGVLDGAAVAAKVAWIAAHEPARWKQARWILTPRDFVLRCMTEATCTDPTMVSAAGLTDSAGVIVPELGDVLDGRLPPGLASGAVAGALRSDAARELGLKGDLPVVVGGGDRACEALGTAASPERPFVAWGTTANVSVPVPGFPLPVPPGVVVTRGASEGWLLEGGLSAAGSLLRWLSSLTGLDPGSLMARAATAPPGARGVVALPWLGGARAPWWRGRARGAFLGLSFTHDAADLARAAVEAVAFDVRRALAATGAPATSVTLTGTEGTSALWGEVVSAVTGLPALRRRSGASASVGAALLAAPAIGMEPDLERLDPVVEVVTPDPAAMTRYAEIALQLDEVAATVVEIETPEEAP